MSWPHATDYNAAVQNPLLCFSDDDLRQGQAVGDLLGLPRPHSGNFADVYQIQGADGQSWAVKCFTRPVAGLRPRYQAISEHLRQTQRAFMVEFHFLDEGIRILGQWYPLVKMRWVEGFRFNEFVREQLNKPAVLERLAQMWLRLGQELRDAGMAHGDLQHGNVLLVPGSKSSSLALKLIDYDGMFVPALADLPSGEVGHPNYQHPQRLREGGYDREMDRFAHLLIYTALRCVRLGGAELWQRHDSGENLLFREEDFRQPSKSRLLRELWDMKDRDTHYLVGHLLLASRVPRVVMPALDELVDESGIRPLSDSEEAQIRSLLGGETVAPRRSRLVAATVGPAFQSDAPSPARKPDLRESPTLQTAALSETQPIVMKSVPPPLPPRRRTPAEIERDTQPPLAEKPRDAVPLVDPIVSILSRPAWLATLGAIGLLSFLVLNVLVWSSVKQPASTPAPVRPPVFAPLKDVSLREGYKTTIHFPVERRDCRGPLTVRIDGLPDALKAPEDREVSSLVLGEDEESCSLRLLAPLGVSPPQRTIHVSLWEGDDKKDEQMFHLSVHPIPRPSLQAPDNLVCPAGRSKTFTFPVKRNACREPLFVTLEGLPLQVQQDNPRSTDAEELSVKLTVADDLTPQAIPLKLLLHVGDVVADSKPLLLNVEKDSTEPVKDEPRVRLSLKTPDALAVEAGESGELRVLLDRGQNRSEVEVSLTDLPAGATAAPVTIPSALSLANVNLDTAFETKPGAYKIKLHLRSGTQTFEERDITLRVSRPRGQQENVRIRTIDHMELAGTLYHGWKGKKGMTVLMLHDLSRHRATSGWKRLAETLQAEGHTVLTFDFRGHGDSVHVPRGFWEYPVNRYMLPTYVRDKPLDDHPSKLEWAGIPAEYAPWLLHDIAAARMFLDLRHDDPNSPVNTFNMVVFGAGQASSLGSLWLASEGVRFNGVDQPNGRIVLKPPEKLSVLQAVWLGMESSLKRRPFAVREWIKWAHYAPLVPIFFVYGEQDADAYRLFQQPMQDNQGKGVTIPNAHSSDQRLLDKDAAASRWMEEYLVKSLKKLPPQPWVPRKIKSLHSYWSIPVRVAAGKDKEIRFFVAKRPGEEVLSPLPLEHFDIAIKGLNKQAGFIPRLPEP